jgi:excinuclease ABC subunit A
VFPVPANPLVNDTLFHVAARHLYGSQTEPAPFDHVSGLEHFDKVISVDQAPIGRRTAL